MAAGAAQAAADRLRTDAAGGSIALVNLPTFKQADAYGYPLTLDGVLWAAPDSAATVVILCDSGWHEGCGGVAEVDWIATKAGGENLQLVDRFEAAPDRILTVYRRSP